MVKQFIDSLSGEIISPDQILSSLSKVIIFGAGSNGKYVKKYLKMNEIEVLYFCDNDPRKWGTFIDSIEVIEPERLLNYKDIPVIIASMWAKDIALQLRKMEVTNYFDLSFCFGFKRWERHFNLELIKRDIEKVENIYDLLGDNLSRKTLLSIIKYRLTIDPAFLEISSYRKYSNPLIKPKTGEVIIDGGAWVGDTAINFAKSLKKKCTIFSFEPATENYNLLLKNIKKEGLTDVVIPVKAGLWNKNCHLYLKTSIDTACNTL